MQCGSNLAYIVAIFVLISEEQSEGYEGFFKKLQKRGVVQRKTEGLYEGDIILDEENVKKQSVPGDPDTWVSRRIPFVFDSSLDPSMIRTIRMAMNQITSKTSSCIRFDIKRDFDVDYVNITGEDDGCYGSVGRRGGTQYMNLGKNCNSIGIVLHELMHALGFWHEQSRSDRDKFVQIRLENVFLGEESNFNKRSKEPMEDYVCYDYDSILHYRYDQFSKNGLDTIVPIDRHVDKSRLGQRQGLSQKDIQRIKWLYDCRHRYCPDMRRFFMNGRVNINSFAVGGQAKYRCNRSFRLLGADTRLCKSDGTWSGAVPYCVDERKYPFLYYDMNTEEGLTHTSSERWARNKGQTPSEDTGPHVDHTNEDSTGWYLYLEATNIPVKTTASVMTESVKYVYNGGACLIFWYYMYGEGMGTLNVYVTSGGNSRRVWSSAKNGDVNQKKWQLATVNGQVIRMPISSPTYKVVFEAIRGDKDTSDIAIDDVIFGHCSVTQNYQNAISDERKNEQYGSMAAYGSNGLKKFK